MFFEGSEKKAEVIIDGQQLSLLNDINDDFWHELVACCHAQVLSTIANDDCKAFLLSESSLFVWDDRFLILTCGETRLVHSVEYFILQHGLKVIKHLTYQRKNEYFAHAQPSSFGDDIRLLSQHLDGSAYRFGELDSHHNYIFQYNNDFIADKSDKTCELLAYQISKQASLKLTNPGLKAADIRQYLRLSELLPGFELDDFVFDPFGYSVNAINGKQYFTIHITPQENSSYVSFESNVNLIGMAEVLLAILQPASFDLLTFNEDDFDGQIKQAIPNGYLPKSYVQETLNNGYFVCFSNFIRPVTTFSKPTKLDLAGENNAL